MVVATEVSKASVAVAQHNLKQNEVVNAKVFRVSSEEFTEAWKGRSELNRLKEVDFKTLKLETLLVDPPRAGLDDETVQLLKEFKQIVYVSCNPDTLHDNLLQVAETHKITKFALFDQFPYTDHIECGVFLERIANAEEPDQAVKKYSNTSDQQQIENNGSGQELLERSANAEAPNQLVKQESNISDQQQTEKGGSGQGEHALTATAEVQRTSG